jgi:cytochrome c oxidase subunit 3
MLAVGVVVWLGSEFMFFSGLFAAFFTIRAHNMPMWPPAGTFPPGTHLDKIQAGVFTFVLLASSPTFQLGVWAQERGSFKAARNWIITSFLLGAAFLGNQMYEWKTLPFRARTNAYGSLFYIMSGLHGLHVLLGLVAMIALLGRLAGSIKGGDPGETAVFQAVSYYWHFVDIVWIGLFSALFLLA